MHISPMVIPAQQLALAAGALQAARENAFRVATAPDADSGSVLLAGIRHANDAVTALSALSSTPPALASVLSQVRDGVAQLQRAELAFRTEASTVYGLANVTRAAAEATQTFGLAVEALSAIRLR